MTEQQKEMHLEGINQKTKQRIRGKQERHGIELTGLNRYDRHSTGLLGSLEVSEVKGSPAASVADLRRMCTMLLVLPPPPRILSQELLLLVISELAGNPGTQRIAEEFEQQLQASSDGHHGVDPVVSADVPLQLRAAPSPRLTALASAAATAAAETNRPKA